LFQLLQNYDIWLWSDLDEALPIRLISAKK
jgi:hypothetical protein